jgi:hypothetical protein
MHASEPLGVDLDQTLYALDATTIDLLAIPHQSERDSGVKANGIPG